MSVLACGFGEVRAVAVLFNVIFLLLPTCRRRSIKSNRMNERTHFQSLLALSRGIHSAVVDCVVSPPKLQTLVFKFLPFKGGLLGVLRV